MARKRVSAAQIPAPSSQPTRRQQASAGRRQAILDAALVIFAAEGFAAARLDHIADRAGVAKGTIYLSFTDKEDLFEHIVTGAIAPIIARAATITADPTLTSAARLSMLTQLFRSEVLSTERKEIIRLMLTEGRRFPRIAEFYYRNVVVKGLAMIRQLAAQAKAEGEPLPDAIERFPQLVVAPMLLSVMWDGLFSNFAPLDVEGLLKAHGEILLGKAGKLQRKRNGHAKR